MAQRDLLRRYLDAGLAFTAMTKSRAEEIARELVKAGEIQRDQVQSQVDELIERSRRNSDHLVAVVRKEVAAQLTDLATTLRDELRNLEQRFGGMAPGHSDAAGSDKATKTTAKKGPGKKGPSKKAPGQKTPTEDSGQAAAATVKKGPARESAGVAARTADKTAAKKAHSKNSTAKMPSTKKPPADGAATPAPPDGALVKRPADKKPSTKKKAAAKTLGLGTETAAASTTDVVVAPAEKLSRKRTPTKKAGPTTTSASATADAAVTAADATQSADTTPVIIEPEGEPKKILRPGDHPAPTEPATPRAIDGAPPADATAPANATTLTDRATPAPADSPMLPEAATGPATEPVPAKRAPARRAPAKKAARPAVGTVPPAEASDSGSAPS